MRKIQAEMNEFIKIENYYQESQFQHLQFDAAIC